MKVMILSNQSRSMLNFWSVLIERLQAAGCEVSACAPKGDAQSADLLAKKGVRLLEYPLSRKGLNPFDDIQTFFALRRILRQERPDVLFSTTIKPVIYGSLAAKMEKIPKIFATITGLGYAFEADTPLKKAVNMIGASLYRRALAGIDGVFFQNEDDLEVFRTSHILQPDARIFMARGTGVDTSRFAPAPLPPAPLKFLLIGRLLEAKGLYEYAKAAETLKKKWPEASFQVLGQPESGRGSVPVEQLKEWQSQGILEYLGECRDVRPHIAASHVVVLPSWREGVPTALMEAMSMGRPCVASNAPGCREVVRNGENGFLFPVKDAAALAASMERLLEEPALLAPMGAAGRRIATAEFEAANVAEKIIDDMGIGGKK